MLRYVTLLNNKVRSRACGRVGNVGMARQHFRSICTLLDNASTRRLSADDKVHYNLGNLGDYITCGGRLDNGCLHLVWSLVPSRSHNLNFTNNPSVIWREISLTCISMASVATRDASDQSSLKVIQNRKWIKTKIMKIKFHFKSIEFTPSPLPPTAVCNARPANTEQSTFH